MSEIAQTSSDLGSGPVVVHVDAAFEPLLPKFMTNRKKEITAMREAVAQGDFETVRKVAHGMKGVSGSYGFPEMTTIAARLEQAAKTTDAGSICQDLSVLASYLDRVEVVYD
jgi:HPt (histidine-containing phosphotransfer) domain-containing protein